MCPGLPSATIHRSRCALETEFEQRSLVGLEQFISIDFDCFVPYPQNGIVFGAPAFYHWVRSTST